MNWHEDISKTIAVRGILESMAKTSADCACLWPFTSNEEDATFREKTAYDRMTRAAELTETCLLQLCKAMGYTVEKIDG